VRSVISIAFGPFRKPLELQAFGQGQFAAIRRAAAQFRKARVEAVRECFLGQTVELCKILSIFDKAAVALDHLRDLIAQVPSLHSRAEFPLPFIFRTVA
jgi:hypothetical protein